MGLENSSCVYISGSLILLFRVLCREMTFKRKGTVVGLETSHLLKKFKSFFYLRTHGVATGTKIYNYKGEEKKIED